MKQPPGFIDPKHPDHVCLLHKSIYGLKKASRTWFQRLTQALDLLGFKGSNTDPSLFIYSHTGIIIYMLIYVDDIIIVGNKNVVINKIITQLSATLSIKDLSNLSYFLGIEIVPRGSDIILSQRKYILELLQKLACHSENQLHLR